MVVAFSYIENLHGKVAIDHVPNFRCPIFCRQVISKKSEKLEQI